MERMFGYIIVLYAAFTLAQSRGNNCTNGERCQQPCGHCSNGCDEGTGKCMGGCQPGYKGHDCWTHCTDGTYGTNCSRRCQCVNNFPCNKASGACYCNVNDAIPENGRVETIIGESVSYTCYPGYQLVGTSTHRCLFDGQWNHPAPHCVQQKDKLCPNTTDSNGTLWTDTFPGQVHVLPCANDFYGNVSRQCTLDSEWLAPVYNCVRRAIGDILSEVEMLNVTSSPENFTRTIQVIASLTKEGVNSTSTHFTSTELNTLTSTLENVADILLSSDVTPTGNLSNVFLDSVSNLIDKGTHNQWKTTSNGGDSGTVKVLSTVDKFTTYLRQRFNSSSAEPTTIVKANIAILLQTINDSVIEFPDRKNVIPDSTADWIKYSKSSISLLPSALPDPKVKHVTTAVMYKDISDILPTVTIDDKEGNNSDGSGEINGPNLSLSVSPGLNATLRHPVIIVFQHQHLGFREPSCRFWQYQRERSGYWSSRGCEVVSTNETSTVCACSHMTNFAVLMSPFQMEEETTLALELISIIGMSISIVCLVITTSVHVWLWKYLKKERTYLLMHLCVALILSYVLFLAGVDRTNNKVLCTVIAALLHYIFLVVFCVMLAEGIEIAITVLYVFKTRTSVIKWLLLGAWGIPSIIVGVALGVTQLDGYGTRRNCWLSTDHGLIWAFVGPALAIILFNVICLGLVFRAVYFTRAVEMKKRLEKVKTGLRTLCVLVPVTGVAWLLGIFYIDENSYFMQYLFAICNGLQGLFVFLFHCLLNPQVRTSFLKRTKKYSITDQSRSTQRGQTLADRKIKEKKEFNTSSNGNSSYSNGFHSDTLNTDVSSKET